MNNFISHYQIDHVEIVCPMAKSLAYWHVHALGFDLVAKSETDNNTASYLVTSGNIRIVLTTTFPTGTGVNYEIQSFINSNYCGVKRFALNVSSVQSAFEECVENGAIPIKFPTSLQDKDGRFDLASIKLYDNSEILLINREGYSGVFKPGFKAEKQKIGSGGKCFFHEIDHIASEVRINESAYWTEYLTKTIGTVKVQGIDSGPENHSGMILKINQAKDKNLTLVIAEPESYKVVNKVQSNIDKFGPGIHHLAFSTDNLFATVKALDERDVEFVQFPDSYYELLRSNKDFSHLDIDTLQRNGILVDLEGDTCLYQKFIKPITDRPFFIYEIVQRVNGYNGFALKNINVLKKAEEVQIMRMA